MGKRKPTGRNQKGRKASPVDLANLEKAQGKQTGPVTQEGKAIASMNGIKTGERMRMFHRITHQAGKMKICISCGEEMQLHCSGVKRCELQDAMIVSYFKARSERNVEYIEDMDLIKIANLNFIFISRIKYAIDHIDDEWTNEETGRKGLVIGTDYMYMLSQMNEKLSTSLHDMQLTRKSMEENAGMWAGIAEKHIEDIAAKEYLEKLEKNAIEMRRIITTAKDKRKSDADVVEYEKLTGQDNDDNVSVDVDALGDSKFHG
ncbi:MAG: hypothetical protein A2Y94_14040 [Caldithrix sp. RBG_13_44_9]|nr:MAG: hypothetical protein A2Y94_14040 [Caldithrix sp. RBG_13_44_9]